LLKSEYHYAKPFHAFTDILPRRPARVEPSLPFPPPPPFIPLESTTVDRQIGLLQGFYKDKARQAAAPLLPPPPVPIFTPPEDTVLDDFIGAAFTALEDTKDVKKRLKKESSPELPRVPIPDDKPDSSHIKMGPLGQVTLIAPQSSKKKKDKDKKEEEDGPDVKKEKKEKGLPGSKKSKKVTIEGEEGEGKKRKRKDKDGAEGPKTKKKKVVIQPPIHTPLGLSDAPQVTV
jgi:transcriptional activator SPT7